MIARCLGSYSSWADPVPVELDTALEDDIDHFRPIELMVIHLDVAFLPSMNHLILADPLLRKFDTIMWCLVQLKDVFQAELHSFVFTAEGRVWIVVRGGEIDGKMMSIVSDNIFSSKQVIEIMIANMILIDINTHCISNEIHILLTNELVVDSEAISMSESAIEVFWAHLFATMTHQAAVLGLFSLQMFDNHWIIGTYLKAVRFNALAKEDRNSILVTDLDMRIHREALAVPELVQIPLAYPLLALLGVKQMTSLQEDTLVMFNISIQLIVVGHSLSEEAIFMACLLLFVLHQFV